MRLFFLFLFFFSSQVFSQQLLAQWASIYDGISRILNLDFNLYEHIDKIFISERTQKISKKFNKKFDKMDAGLNEIIKKEDAKRILSENSNDTLSAFCNNVGYKTEVSIDQYYCLNQKVRRAEFEIIMLQFYNTNVTGGKNNVRTYTDNLFENYTDKNVLPCKQNSTISEVCYCPLDYYGIFCENFNTISCKYEKTNIDCPIIENEFYVSSYGGDPPCYQIGEKIEIELLINCQNREQYLLYEGIKVPFDFNSTEKSSHVFPEFKYFLNTRGLASSIFFNIEPQLEFTNWESLIDSYIMIFSNLYLFQINGAYPVKLSVNSSEVPNKYNIFGRYYSELYFIINHANMSDGLSSSNRNYFYFDDLNYNEPQAKRGLSMKLIILLVAIGFLYVFKIIRLVVFLAIFGGLIYYFYFRKKEPVASEEKLRLSQHYIN